MKLNLIVFRLSTCCGLRASEIGGLKVSDFRLGIERPHIRVRASIAKGRKARRIPLWWDGQTLADLTLWHSQRLASHGPDARFVAPLTGSKQAFCRQGLRNRFRTACKVLGKDRLMGLTIHDGRHSFVSHALAGGRTLAEVRDAAGHASISTTSIYTHVAVDDCGAVGSLFAAK